VFNTKDRTTNGSACFIEYPCLVLVGFSLKVSAYRISGIFKYSPRNHNQIWCPKSVESGGAGESHPHAPTDPYVNLSIHTAPLIQPIEDTQTTSFVLCKQFLLRLHGVDHSIRPDKLTPSLHLHYRDFFTTTS
jgi:hypothetical protein